MALATGAPFALARCGLQQPTLLGGQRISAAGPQRSSRQTEGARAHAGRCTGAHRRRCERRTGTWRVQQGAARAAREQPRSALRSRPRVSAAPAPLLLASAARAAHGGCTLCGRVSAGPVPHRACLLRRGMLARSASPARAAATSRRLDLPTSEKYQPAGHWTWSCAHVQGLGWVGWVWMA